MVSSIGKEKGSGSAVGASAWRVLGLGVALAWCIAIGLSACGEWEAPSAASCLESGCPDGYRCLPSGACEPLTPGMIGSPEPEPPVADPDPVDATPVEDVTVDEPDVASDVESDEPTPEAPRTGRFEVTGLVGPEGGTLEYDAWVEGRHIYTEVRLEIPPGALSEETEITMRWVADSPAWEERVSENTVALWHFSPSGLEFAEPATLHFTYDEDAFRERMGHSYFPSFGHQRSDGSNVNREVLLARPAGSTGAVTQLHHFSSFELNSYLLEFMGCTERLRGVEGPTVILVHGWTGGRSTFGAMPNLIRASAPTVCVVWFIYTQQSFTVAIPQIAFGLGAALRGSGLGSQYSSTNTHYIAHSLGGLVVRALLSGHARSIENETLSSCTIVEEVPPTAGTVLTLGTPHRGANGFLTQYESDADDIFTQLETCLADRVEAGIIFATPTRGVLVSIAQILTTVDLPVSLGNNWLETVPRTQMRSSSDFLNASSRHSLNSSDSLRTFESQVRSAMIVAGTGDKVVPDARLYCRASGPNGNARLSNCDTALVPSNVEEFSFVGFDHGALSARQAVANIPTNGKIGSAPHPTLCLLRQLLPELATIASASRCRIIPGPGLSLRLERLASGSVRVTGTVFEEPEARHSLMSFPIRSSICFCDANNERSGCISDQIVTPAYTTTNVMDNTMASWGGTIGAMGRWVDTISVINRTVNVPESARRPDGSLCVIVQRRTMGHAVNLSGDVQRLVLTPDGADPDSAAPQGVIHHPRQRCSGATCMFQAQMFNFREAATLSIRTSNPDREWVVAENYQSGASRVFSRPSDLPETGLMVVLSTGSRDLPPRSITWPVGTSGTVGETTGSSETRVTLTSPSATASGNNLTVAGTAATAANRTVTRIGLQLIYRDGRESTSHVFCSTRDDGRPPCSGGSSVPFNYTFQLAAPWVGSSEATVNVFLDVQEVREPRTVTTTNVGAGCAGGAFQHDNKCWRHEAAATRTFSWTGTGTTDPGGPGDPGDPTPPDCGSCEGGSCCRDWCPSACPNAQGQTCRVERRTPAQGQYSGGTGNGNCNCGATANPEPGCRGVFEATIDSLEGNLATITVRKLDGTAVTRDQDVWIAVGSQGDGCRAAPNMVLRTLQPTLWRQGQQSVTVRNVPVWPGSESINTDSDSSKFLFAFTTLRPGGTPLSPVIDDGGTARLCHLGTQGSDRYNDCIDLVLGTNEDPNASLFIQRTPVRFDRVCE